jgi:hypothetical protein
MEGYPYPSWLCGPLSVAPVEALFSPILEGNTPVSEPESCNQWYCETAPEGVEAAIQDAESIPSDLFFTSAPDLGRVVSRLQDVQKASLTQLTSNALTQLGFYNS